MQPQPVVLNHDYVWGVLPTRIEAAIDAKTVLLWDRVGLFREFGPFGIHFTGEDEGEEIKKEVGAVIIRALDALHLRVRRSAATAPTVTADEAPGNAVAGLATGVVVAGSLMTPAPWRARVDRAGCAVRRCSS